LAHYEKKKVGLVRHTPLINIDLAKSGDELFWEDKLHAAKGTAQNCSQVALLFLH
jgi:hypothetical protein